MILRRPQSIAKFSLSVHISNYKMVSEKQGKLLSQNNLRVVLCGPVVCFKETGLFCLRPFSTWQDMNLISWDHVTLLPGRYNANKALKGFLVRTFDLCVSHRFSSCVRRLTWALPHADGAHVNSEMATVNRWPRWPFSSICSTSHTMLRCCRTSMLLTTVSPGTSLDLSRGSRAGCRNGPEMDMTGCWQGPGCMLGETPQANTNKTFALYSGPFLACSSSPSWQLRSLAMCAPREQLQTENKKHSSGAVC